MTMRLVTEDWHERLQARLNEDSAAATAAECEQESDCSRHERDGLLFGPYGSDPITGLHFDTPDDTAAS